VLAAEEQTGINIYENGRAGDSVGGKIPFSVKSSRQSASKSNATLALQDTITHKRMQHTQTPTHTTPL